MICLPRIPKGIYILALNPQCSTLNTELLPYGCLPTISFFIHADHLPAIENVIFLNKKKKKETSLLPAQLVSLTTRIIINALCRAMHRHNC